MPVYTHKLSFPCPDCGGILTMHSPEASGCCPLCNSDITVSLTVQSSPVATLGEPEQDNRLAWDKRAFRRCSELNPPALKSRPAETQ